MTDEEKKSLKDKGLKQGKDLLIQLAQAFLNSTKGKELIAKTEDIPISDVKKIINDPNKFEKYKPIIKVYTTEGRIYDKQTTKPILGVKVEPRFTLYPVKYENKSWSEDKDKPAFTRTDSEGRFKLQFGVPVIQH